MFPQLDIFKLENDGSLVWKKTAENLQDAKVTVKGLATASPGDYVVFSQRTGHKTIVHERSTQRR